MNIVGVDVGRCNVKVFYQSGHFMYPSNLGELRDMEFTDERGKDDIIGEYRGRHFTAGTITRESDYQTPLMTENKVHEDTLILTLIGLHKAFESSEVGIVTNLPINNHSKDKKRLKQLLEGFHEITLNGVKKSFHVHCEVAPEGSGIFKYAGPGVIHGLNIGSRTVNAITFEDGVKIGRLSDTFDFGTLTNKSKNTLGMGKEIAGRISQLKWHEEEPIYLCGGGASEVVSELMRYYRMIRITPDPMFTDAEAFYKIAREVYEL
ncbi:ParM/StbA family protein [Pullulanibacillus sp. KACC 23026]|uniref:ParM/StbA family protein n=1 Tax=Pullulanibacillus sp. KACC 23026 TaxID=3028315 RepID=UPI0023B133F5|nr:ParM/StbA family protein [Pullulanibacillus sp. KACC 23026]WEG14181.1 ParM/StbA family protein [Pullulanibacillus sp. KACC 23026]